MIFLPVRIFSSSPKLNFFMNTPVPTATAAAGVESFKIQLSIFSKAELILVTIFGSPKAKQKLFKIKKSKYKFQLLFTVLKIIVCEL